MPAMTQEFSDHPEVAARRMRWVRQLAVTRLNGNGARCEPLFASALQATDQP
jgi:hypothetical protein